jgi:protein-disulfide isomerase
VEFSDFQCPFCAQAQATLKQILERYPGKVKLVYRDLPLDAIHPQARRAAEAARCARDQGKFWEYHDLLFGHFPQAAPDDLKQYAQQVGLDLTSSMVVSQGEFIKPRCNGRRRGYRLGITARQLSLVNGRPYEGAQPLDAFTRLIEQELGRVAASGKGKE